MNAALLFFALLQLPAAGPQPDENLRVTLVGRPAVRHVMLSTQRFYWGNDTELAQEVQVLDSEGLPVPGRIVTLMARTEDGVIARVRQTAITGVSGRGTARGIFEVGSSDMRISLQACVQSTDQCSPFSSVDLRQPLIVDLSGTFLYGATLVENKTVSAVQSREVVNLQARVEYSVLDRGRDRKHLSLTAYGETSSGFTRTETVAVVNNQLGVGQRNDISPQRAALGVTATIPHVAVDVGVSDTAARQWSAEAFQSVSRRVSVLGGFTSSTGRADADSGALSARGPLAGVAYVARSGQYRITGTGAWLTQSDAKSQRSANLKLDYYRGGAIHLTALFAGTFTDGVSDFATGLKLTFRQPLALGR